MGKKISTKKSMSYEDIFNYNKNWVGEKLSEDPEYFLKMKDSQDPRFLFIGCSDSRIDASAITGTKAGDMFIHRNIANLVIHSDINCMSVLQYSVEVLKVEHIIVCGHYRCGGIYAALDHQHHGLIDKWLRNIKDVYRLYYEELDAIKDRELRARRLVELNVREQVYHLYVTSIVQRARELGRNIELHGWVYDIAEGYLIDLKINPEHELKGGEIYKYRFLQDDKITLHGK